MATKPMKIRKAVIPAAGPSSALAIPEVYALVSRCRDYGTALGDLFEVVFFI